MKEISLIKHAKGAIGLRVFGLGPNLKPTNGFVKLQKFLDNNAFWANNIFFTKHLIRPFLLKF